MPTVEYMDEEIECEHGANLKKVLIENGLTPHRGITKQLNCGGHGTCGTCAVRVVDGGVGENEQQTRLKFSRFRDEPDVRLSCQFAVTEDITIEQP